MEKIVRCAVLLDNHYYVGNLRRKGGGFPSLDFGLRPQGYRQKERKNHEQQGLYCELHSDPFRELKVWLHAERTMGRARVCQYRKWAAQAQPPCGRSSVVLVLSKLVVQST